MKTVLTWILTVVLALVALGAGLSKLFGEQAQVDLFADIGAGQWLRYFVGVCEVAGAVGLFVPRVRALAAVGLTLLFVGATAINLFVVGENPVATMVLAAVAAILVRLRRGELSRRTA